MQHRVHEAGQRTISQLQRMRHGVSAWYMRRVPADTQVWPWWLPEPMWPTWQRTALAAVLYAFLTVVWTWPLLPGLTQGVIVPAWNLAQPDVSQNVWNVWHFMNTWSQGAPLLTQAVFYPQQVNLIYQSYGISQLILAAPIAAWLGPIAGANSILAMGFWGGALGMFVVLHALIRRPWLAMMLAWVYAITPAHQMNVAWAADENAALQWLMLLHVTVVLWLRRPDWRRSLVVVGALCVNTLASGYFGLFGAVYVGLVVIWALWSRWVPMWHRQVVSHGVLIVAVWGALAVALLTPPLATYPYQVVAGDAGNPLVRDRDLTLTDWYMRQTIATHVVAVSDLVVPTPDQRWWQWLTPGWHIPGSQMGGYLGLSVVAVMMWATWRLPVVRSMVLLAGVLLWLAAGLEVRIWPGQPFPALPGPFWLLNTLSLFRNASRPGLFLLWAWIPLLLALAYALAHIRRPVLVGVIVACMWLEFAPMAWVLTPQRASAVAQELAKSHDLGAVLTVPFGKNDARPLLDQMCHGRSIMTGYLARVPTQATSLRTLLRPADLYADVIPVQVVTELAQLGVRYVVLTADAPPEHAVSLRAGGAELWEQVEGDQIWRIPAPTVPALVPGPGWWDPEQAGATRWRWSTDMSEVWVVSQHDALIQLAATMSRTDEAQPMMLTVNGRDFGAVEVPQMPVMLDRVWRVPVQAGLNRIAFHTRTTTDAAGRAIGISFTRLELAGSSLVPGGAVLPAAPQYDQRWLCP